MNCQDIGRILDSGKFGSLSANERRDAEAHAHSCRHCAPRWGVHSRMATMPIAPMPQEFAERCQALVAARGRSSVLRLVPRRMMVLVGSCVVLAAAAGVLTSTYSPLKYRKDVAATPEQVPTQAAAPPVALLLRGTPPSQPVVAPAAPAPSPSFPDTRNKRDNQNIGQIHNGEPDMNKSKSIALTAAALGAAVVAQAQTPIQAPEQPAVTSGRITSEQIIAPNDLNKDGIVTHEEAAQVNGSLFFMWVVYDMDRDGKVDAAEVTRASRNVAVGSAMQRITGDKGPNMAMASAESVIAANDQNGDGIVTKEEATKADKALIRIWKMYDINNDGKIDIPEINKAQGY